MSTRYGHTQPRDVDVVVGMSRKLTEDIARMQRQADGEPITTFLYYKKMREEYLNIQGLIFLIQERAERIPKQLPDGFHQWVIRGKLKALSAFTRVCHKFFSNPPITVTHSLGAWDILSEEQEKFRAVSGYFDMMIMEAGIDDKTADALESTRVEIEEIVTMLEHMLQTSPKRLEEF
jgi:hypothetical protein